MDLVIDELVKTLLQAAAPIIAAGIIAVLVRVFQRIGLSLSAENQARTEKMVHDAIFFAEEKAAAWAKAKATPFKDKLSVAVGRILDKVPGITEQEAADLVHQELGKVGLGASGFIRAVAIAATNAEK